MVCVGGAIGSSQFCSQSLPCTNFRARVRRLRARYVYGRNHARNL